MKGLVAWWGRNPVAGNLLMLACFVAGFLSFMRMEKEFFPPGRDQAVMVQAYWPGASPEDMESQVTVRIEEALADLDGINWVRSRSQEGSAWVRMVANPGVDIEDLTAEARSRVSAISGLPPSLEPLQVSQQVFRDWARIISVHGPAGEAALRETAERLRDKIALVDGATNAEVVGARQPEVSIEISEAALQRWGLTFDDVARAIQRTSINLSSGSVRTDDGDYQLRARNLADTPIDFETIVIRETPEGGMVRVSDVAERVIDGFQDVNAYSRMNDDPSLIVVVPTGDRFDLPKVDKEVSAIIAEFRKTLPQGVEVTDVYNQQEDFSALTGILFQNAVQGFILIFLMLLLSLHPTVAFWATAGVITAFMGSFFILPYVDVSMNFMTVFGFLLVLGIMVDDAIVVGEAIYERVERGGHGADSSIFATQLVLKPLIASVCVTMIAFLPMMLLQSEVQQFTRSLSIVVMSTLVFSLIECLIILPAHLAHVSLPKKSDGLFGRFMAFQQRCAHSIIWFARKVHLPLLAGAVKWRYLTLAIFIGIFAVAIGLMNTGRLKQSFMPEIEGDFLQIQIELPQTTPFARMEEVAEQLSNARRALEQETAEFAVKDVNTGAMSRGVIRSWSQAINERTLQAWVTLTPPEGRPELRSKKVVARLEKLMGAVPDAQRMSFSLQGVNDGPAIQIAIQGENQADLRAAVDELKARLVTYAAVSSVRDSEEAAIEELRFRLKPGAEQTGVTIAELSRQVRQAYFGEEVQRLPRNGDEVRVYVRYPRDDRRTLESLQHFRVRTPDGREVPLSAVADVDFAPGVTGIDRRQRLRSILVEADAIKEKRQEVMTDLDKTFFPSLEAKYPTISRKAIGEAEAQAEFGAELGPLVMMALFAIYFLLAVVFRSYWQPALILSAIPFAIVGAVVGHIAFGTTFAMFSILGIIATAGVVVNDNVVLVDKANQIRGLFGLRRLGADERGREDEMHSLVTGGDGSVWQIRAFSKDFELNERLLGEAAARNFERGPIEVIRLGDAKLRNRALREHAEEAAGEGYLLARVEAEAGIVEAGVSRFRQIFLTSLTEFIGLAPMLFEIAAIAQFLKPMALSMAFGVLLCMPVTLILTPVWYMVAKDIKGLAGRLQNFWLEGWNGRGGARRLGSASAAAE